MCSNEYIYRHSTVVAVEVNMMMMVRRFQRYEKLNGSSRRKVKAKAKAKMKGVRLSRRLKVWMWPSKMYIYVLERFRMDPNALFPNIIFSTQFGLPVIAHLK